MWIGCGMVQLGSNEGHIFVHVIAFFCIMLHTHTYIYIYIGKFLEPN